MRYLCVLPQSSCSCKPRRVGDKVARPPEGHSRMVTVAGRHRRAISAQFCRGLCFPDRAVKSVQIGSIWVPTRSPPNRPHMLDMQVISSALWARLKLGAHRCASWHACDSARRATTLNTSRRIAALLARTRNQ